MSHSIDQSSLIKGFFIKNQAEILTDLIFVSPVFDRLLNIIKHTLCFQVRTTVARSFQRTDGSSDRRISICSGRSNNVSCERRVVTTTVLCMKNECYIKNLGFELCILSVRTKHIQNILGKRASFFRVTDQESFIFTEMSVRMIRINCNQWKLCNQFQRLAQCILYRNIFRILIVCI